MPFLKDSKSQLKHAQTVTIFSPHPVLLSRLWTTIQQDRIEFPEDGALKRRNM
jgi:hypothetical protein